MKQNLLKLYITGRTSRSQEAVQNLRRIYKSFTSPQFDIVVIDVLENPDQAEEDKILATPTLIYSTEVSSNRIIGDISNLKEVMKLLDLSYTDKNQSKE